MHLLFAVLLAVTQHWLLVSDLHVNPFDRDPRPPPYGQDSNWALFDATVAEMQKVQPDAPVVVVSGDFLAHSFDAKAREAKAGNGYAAALNTMARIERSFAHAFPRAQFLIALGNNDDPCGDYRTAPNTPYLRALARIWAPLVNRAGRAPRFVADFSQAGDYAARLPRARLQAIVLDDVYWSFVFRPCSLAAARMPAAQMRRLSQRLSAIPNDERAMLVMHIPPGVDPSTTLRTHRFLVVPFWRSDIVPQFVRVMQSNRSRIAFALAGHIHRSDLRLAGGVPMLIAPAVSPIYSNNPSFLDVALDDSGTVRDYRMFAFDLESESWTSPFDFDRVYGVDDLTAKSVDAVHTALGRAPALRQTWEASLMSFADDPDVRAGWRVFWCAQTHLQTGFAECAGTEKRVIALPVALGVAVAAVIGALVWFSMRITRVRRS